MRYLKASFLANIEPNSGQVVFEQERQLELS